MCISVLIQNVLFIKFQCLLSWSELFVRSAMRPTSSEWQVVGQHIPKVCAFLKKIIIRCNCTVPHDLRIGLESLMLTLQFSKNRPE